MTPFDKDLKTLDLSYAQEQLIKQMVEKHIIGKNVDINDAPTDRAFNNMIGVNIAKDKAREALWGEEK